MGSMMWGVHFAPTVVARCGSVSQFQYSRNQETLSVRA